MAAILPSKYIAVVAFANGLIGLAINVFRIILNELLPGQEHLFTIAMIFYVTSGIFVVCCAISYTVLVNNKFFLHYKKIAEINSQIHLYE